VASSGHGKSAPYAPKADWSYDDNVTDTGAFVDFALGLESSGPVFIVGHSLVGHTALAWLGLHPEARVAGFVSVAGNTWQRRHTATWRRSALKYLSMAVVSMVVACVGCVPAKRMGYGSADEARTYFWQLARYFFFNRWVHQQTGADYQQGLRRISCPVLHVISDGDVLTCNPHDGLLFSQDVPKREVLWLRGPKAPNHMALLTDPRQELLWQQMADWLLKTSAQN